MNFTSDNPPFSVQPDGVWHLYSAEYRHNLRVFSVEFYARNDDEAYKMLQSMRANLCNALRVVAVYGGAKARNN